MQTNNNSLQKNPWWYSIRTQYSITTWRKDRNERKLHPLLKQKNTLYCYQFANNSLFTCCKNLKSFEIHHNLNSKSIFAICLMKNLFCKMEYIGKAKTLSTLGWIIADQVNLTKLSLPAYWGFLRLNDQWHHEKMNEKIYI